MRVYGGSTCGSIIKRGGDAALDEGDVDALGMREKVKDL